MGIVQHSLNILTLYVFRLLYAESVLIQKITLIVLTRTVIVRSLYVLLLLLLLVVVA